MKKILIIILVFYTYNLLYAKDITIIELHNKSIDQVINEEMNSDISTQINDSPSINNNFLVSDVQEVPNDWQKIDKDNIFFLLENINEIHSKVLRKEILSFLEITTLIPEELEKNNFDKIIIDTLLKLGDKKKSYKIIESLQIDEENIYNSFYKEFTINYLLSTYNLSEACDYKNEINDLSLSNEFNFFLKIDIFCLSLNEKFDEANLLNSLLIESNDNDKYFQLLFGRLQNSQMNIDIDEENINEKNIFLYSAMHRIGNLALNEKFLEIDPINLSMPIILSSSTNLELRLKAAHFAFFNDLINIDSLAALYQIVDFTYEQLNNPSEFLSSIDQKPEIGMAYFYQLINIQLLPITRLEAIIKFWDFAEKYNLENIAYNLSLKNLDSLDPSSELKDYSPGISKAYIVGKDYLKAEEWISFAEKSMLEDESLLNLNSSKLLLSLSNIKEKEDILDILTNNFDEIKNDLNNKKSNVDQLKNEYLYLIYSSLKTNNENNFFDIEKKVLDDKPMPSLFLINTIRDSAVNNNELQLLLSIALSMNMKKWNEIHLEHLKIIIKNLKDYRDGAILNDILIEILKDCKII